MSPDELKKKIESLSDGTVVEITDLTGTQDHYQANIASPAFKGKLLMDQHRIVMKLLQKEIDSGELHALTLKTKVI